MLTLIILSTIALIYNIVAFTIITFTRHALLAKILFIIAMPCIVLTSIGLILILDFHITLRIIIAIIPPAVLLPMLIVAYIKNHTS